MKTDKTFQKCLVRSTCNDDFHVAISTKNRLANLGIRIFQLVKNEKEIVHFFVFLFTTLLACLLVDVDEKNRHKVSLDDGHITKYLCFH